MPTTTWTPSRHGRLEPNERAALARLLNAWPAPISVRRWVHDAPDNLRNVLALGEINLEERGWVRVRYRRQRGRRPMVIEVTGRCLQELPALTTASGRTTFIAEAATQWLPGTVRLQ